MKRCAIKRATPFQRGAKLCRVGKRGRAIRSVLSKIRPLVLSRDGYICQRCKDRSCRPLDMHHRLARSQGGEHTLENLVVLGRRCHEAVTIRLAADWHLWVVTRKAGVA